MSINFEGRVAIVTGAGNGLGSIPCTSTCGAWCQSCG